MKKNIIFLCCLILCFLVVPAISTQTQQEFQYSFTYGQYPNLKIVEPSRQEFQSLLAGEVMPRGWIKEQMLKDANGYLPAEEKMCPQISREPFFKRADVWGPNTWWNGEQTSYWIDGMVRLAYLTGREDLEEQVT
jgi:hypothetical protein